MHDEVEALLFPGSKHRRKPDETHLVHQCLHTRLECLLLCVRTVIELWIVKDLNDFTNNLVLALISRPV